MLICHSEYQVASGNTAIYIPQHYVDLKVNIFGTASGHPVANQQTLIIREVAFEKLGTSR